MPTNHSIFSANPIKSPLPAATLTISPLSALSGVSLTPYSLEEYSVDNLLKNINPDDPERQEVRALIEAHREMLSPNRIYSLTLLHEGNLLLVKPYSGRIQNDEDEIKAAAATIGKAIFYHVLNFEPESSLSHILSIMSSCNLLTLDNLVNILQNKLEFILYLEILFTLKSCAGDLTPENASDVFKNALLKSKSLQGQSQFYERGEFLKLKELIHQIKSKFSAPIAHQLLHTFMNLHETEMLLADSAKKYILRLETHVEPLKIIRILSLLHSIGFLNKDNIEGVLEKILTQNSAHNLVSPTVIYFLIEKLAYTQEYDYLSKAQTHPHSSKIAQMLFILYYNELLTNANGKYNFINLICATALPELSEIITLFDRCNLLHTLSGQEILTKLFATLNPSNTARITNDLKLLNHYKLLGPEAPANIQRVFDSEMITPVLLALSSKELLQGPEAQKRFEACLKYSVILIEDEDIYQYWEAQTLSAESFSTLINICEFNKGDLIKIKNKLIDFFSTSDLKPSSGLSL